VQVETASAAFGQGIGVTNVQLAMATAAIANGGELMEPVLIKRVTTADGEVVREAAPRVRRRVVPAHVARTGTEAAIDGYRVAGKTATAQKADPGTARYSLDRYIASFVGFVPAEKPVVAIVVTIDEPMVEHAGGAVAAPVFRRVAQASLKLRGLVPRGNVHADVSSLARSPDPANVAMELIRRAQGKGPTVQEGVAANGPVPAGRVRVPDMTGWPAREAMRRAFEMGVTPRLSGSGLLVSQTPAPGAVLDKGQELLLVFEPAS
jgi:cell division protein FtsI (penicillin-binding protein 3)